MNCGKFTCAREFPRQGHLVRTVGTTSTLGIYSEADPYGTNLAALVSGSRRTVRPVRLIEINDRPR